MQFLADTIIEQGTIELADSLALMPKYKVFFDLDAHLSFPYKDYFLPHDNFWIEMMTQAKDENDVHFGFFVNEDITKGDEIRVTFYVGAQGFADELQTLSIRPFDDNGYLKAVVSTVPSESGDANYNPEEMLSMFMQALYALNRRDSVSSKMNGRKVNVSGNKKNRKKHSYSLISRKKYTSKAETSIGRKIEWTFAFPVRGHWRRISGIGKDRHGNYVVKDRTWVKESVKGSGELINKRVVKPS